MNLPVKLAGERLQPALDAVGSVVLGKRHQVRLALVCLLARGHLLLEDRPGVGKTTLAHVLAQVLGLEFNRVQFTSDLLPADILGVSVWDRTNGAFIFHPGPIFTQLVLADEVNRATPKTQSALLEAMEERQVTVEGQTRPLPDPFFVIATQNPVQQVGTFPLPESQLDRFLMRIALGYPDRAAERELFAGRDRRRLIAGLRPVLPPQTLLELQERVVEIQVAEALLDYLQALVEASRHDPQLVSGLSPRAGLALLHSAQAWAMLEGRDHVRPEDLQAVFAPVAGHRLQGAGELRGRSGEDLARHLLESVPIP